MNHQFSMTHIWASPVVRRNLLMAAGCLLTVALLAGCASTEVTSQRTTYDLLPRPNRIIVYDFAASAVELPPNSALAKQNGSTAVSAEQAALVRQLGADMGAQLVTAIQEMGLPAQRGYPGVTAQVNDIILRGYLVSVDEGSAVKRFTIGFGSGASELTTVLEGFQMTPQGLRKVGTGTTTAGGNKAPGTAVGAATFAATGNPAGLIVTSGMKVYGEASGRTKVEGRAKQTVDEIAGRLKARFQEEGWIRP